MFFPKIKKISKCFFNTVYRTMEIIKIISQMNYTIRFLILINLIKTIKMTMKITKY